MNKNVASQKIQLFAFDTTTGAPKTGDAANLTAYVSKDHGAVTVLGDTSAAEMDATNAKGVYLFDLTQGETNADELTFTAKSSTANISITPRFVTTNPANFTLTSIDSNGRMDVIKVAGTTQTAGDIIGDTNDIQTRLPAALVSGRMDSSVGAMAANVITAAATAADFTTEVTAGLSTLDAAGVRTAVGLASANLDTQLSTIDDFLDTEVAAIKAKTDNLPSDPADASDIAASFSTVNSTLATIAAYIDTEVSAIKAKTDNLPASPAAVGSAMALTSGAVDDILDEVVEGTTTMRQMLRGYAAVLLGKASGLATTTAVYRDIGDTKDRVTATVDADGNRSAVTRDLT